MKNNKSLGQHWLKNREILEEIADSAVIDGVDFCLEIGPGLGTLTTSLLRRFKKVIAVEYDERLAANLPKSFPGKNLEVVTGDILEFDFSSLNGDYVIAGNIPYYITSPIIEKVLTTENLAKKVVLLIQKEVAERLLDEKETMLSLFVKNRAEVEAGPIVLKDEFTPPPKVDSQVIVLYPHVPVVNDEVFDLIKQGFKAPRKKLVHNLTGILSRDELTEMLKKLSIDINARPGDLDLEKWQLLYEKINDATHK